jgi:hypothetical protein
VGPTVGLDILEKTLVPQAEIELLTVQPQLHTDRVMSNAGQFTGRARSHRVQLSAEQ